MSEASATGRGVVEVSGPDARDLLQRLITNDVEALGAGEARYAALLTPQGKIVVDFFVISAPQPDAHERFLLDCPALFAPDLTRKLSMYKLRARVVVVDRSADLGGAPVVEAAASVGSNFLVYADPRSTALGLRAVGPHDIIAGLAISAADYGARRVKAGIPEGGIDFLYGDAYPHEANFDKLHGVDFKKGCYVGQEVVSRMQHRGTARKRVASIFFTGAPPKQGTEIRAGDLPVGVTGSVAGDQGLALVRTDRVADALAANIPLLAGGVPVIVGPC